PANGSIQEELGTDETAPLLKYSKSARTSQRDAHDMGINIIDDYRPIFSEEHHENDWHRDSLRPISHPSQSKPFFPKKKIYIFRGQLPGLFELLTSQPLASH